MLRRGVSFLTRVAVMTPRIAFRTLGLNQNELLLDHSLSLKEFVRCLKKGYVARTLECHPDLFPDDESAADRFRELTEALRVALQYAQSVRTQQQEGMSDAYSSVTSVHDATDIMLQWGHAWRAQRSLLHMHSSNNQSPPLLHDPTLDEIADLSRMETDALVKALRFCTELPKVLCGNQPPMFEVFAFHRTGCVQPIADVVLRIAELLPRLVKSVVKLRCPNYTPDVSMNGFGSGEGARHRKIGDMTMKPLVLVGALVIVPTAADVEAVGWLNEGHTTHHGNPISGDGDAPRSDLSSTFTAVGKANLAKLSDIHCCKELVCVLHGEQSLTQMAKQIALWESNSFDRVRVELAIGNITSLLSSMLGLYGSLQLQMQNDLTMTIESVKQVSLTLQRLAMALCFVADVDEAEPLHKDMTFPLRGTNVSPTATERVRCAGSSGADLIREIREIIHDPLLHDVVKRPIRLTLPPQDQWANRMVLTTEDLEVHHESSLDATDPTSALPVTIQRDPTVCVAEDIQFSLSIVLSKHFMDFFTQLKQALLAALSEGKNSQELLPQLLEVRRTTQSEEFRTVKVQDLTSSTVSVTPSTTDEPSEVPTGEESDSSFLEWMDSASGLSTARCYGSTDALNSTPTQYRGSINCFVRVHNMKTHDELRFWQRLNTQREYLAVHNGTVQPMDLFFNCSPHRSATQQQCTPTTSPLPTGWYHDAVDTDHVVLTTADLETDAAFRSWLEEVTEQASLSKECRHLVSKHSLTYLSRDPGLPLCNYLSFLRLFTSSQSDAVRAHFSVAGLHLVISHHCDMQSGKLFLPWNADVAHLISLLPSHPSQVITA